MTPERFLERLENACGRTLTPAQAHEFVGAVREFSPEWLDRIFDRLIRKYKRIVVADVFVVAGELGYSPERPKLATEKPHTFERTDCPYCNGEGRLLLLWRPDRSRDRNGDAEELELAFLAAYSSPKARSLRLENPELIDDLKRCPCSAGQIETLSRAIPVWDGRRRVRRKN